VDHIDENLLQDAILEYIEWNGVSSINQLVNFVWTSHMLLPQQCGEYLKTGFPRPSCFQMTITSAGSIQTDINLSARINIIKLNESLISDLKRITKNHLEFCHRIKGSGILQKIISGSDQLNRVFD